MPTKSPTIITGWTAGDLWRGFVVALMLIIAACGSGPPVQEMSDARQAISVAREAGARERAAADFTAAEAFLASAEKNLAEHAYDEAREDAKQAKAKALDALAAAEQRPEPQDR